MIFNRFPHPSVVTDVLADVWIEEVNSSLVEVIVILSDVYVDVAVDAASDISVEVLTDANANVLVAVMTAEPRGKSMTFC